MNRLNGSSTYLAGPMQHAADNGVIWREEITPFLKELGIKVLDPCKKPGELGKEDAETQAKVKDLLKLFASSTSFQKDYYGDRLHDLMKDIVGIDLKMVDYSDFLICFVDLNQYSCGTWHEVTMAVLERKPVLIYCPSGLQNIPSWLFGVLKHNEFFESITELKNYIRHINEDEYLDVGRWKFLNWASL